jgi:hypothetical protein
VRVFGVDSSNHFIFEMKGSPALSVSIAAGNAMLTATLHVALWKDREKCERRPKVCRRAFGTEFLNQIRSRDERAPSYQRA